MREEAVRALCYRWKTLEKTSEKDPASLRMLIPLISIRIAVHACPIRKLLSNSGYLVAMTIILPIDCLSDGVL